MQEQQKVFLTYDLPPAQEQVLAAIIGGATMKAAAEAASIHRNTISYWRQTSLLFREALSQAQYDKAVFIREEAENHVTDSFAAIHAILTNSDASDSARLNAAKYIIDKASTPPPPKPEVIYHPQNVPEIVHSNAQSPAPKTNATSATSVGPSPAAPKPEIVHSNAQSRPSQTVRTAPKVGRNEPCPCGSGSKFKRCCLGKANLAAAA
jgi:preprotein translocase subunit SecA